VEIKLYPVNIKVFDVASKFTFSTKGSSAFIVLLAEKFFDAGL
jgi:hypothetical protein